VTGQVREAHRNEQTTALVGGDVARAAALIRAGRLVAFPTETVYGLGGDATSDTATAAIFAAKGRPRFNPLIVHVADLDQARALVGMSPQARLLADRFWPGPLTLVLPRRPDCAASLLCSAGLDSLAVRVPRHPLALALLKAAGRPIAAPSANRSGRISPTRPEHVIDELGGRIDMILDGGPCDVGVESTVVDLTGDQPKLLRPGGVAAEALEAILGSLARPAASPADDDARLSPGLLASHYAPGLAVRLDAEAPLPGEAFLGFGPVPPGIRAPDLQLSAAGDTQEAAARLFASLRALDRPPFTAIAVMPIPETGLGAAVNDRLRRAAAPR
jgi:L-threonylcarbamoyladenylate synthase